MLIVEIKDTENNVTTYKQYKYTHKTLACVVSGPEGDFLAKHYRIIGSFASACALLLLAFLPFYFAAAVIMILLGLGDAARRTINQSLVMEKTDAIFQGRVMSVFMMNFGLMPLGVLPAGILMDIFGGQAVIGLLGLILLTFTFVILFTQKNLRNAS